MRPSEVPHRDWHLYYNGTIMRHDTHGIVSVQVNERQIYWKRLGRDNWIAADPTTLSCVWPVASAVNYNGRAVYVARRSRREARRSASSNHYYIAWDGASSRGSMNNVLLRYICHPDEFPSFEFAMEALSTGARESVAITPELILLPDSKGFGVVYKTDAAGVLKPENEGFMFTPIIEGAPAARRAIFKLQKEGMLCH